MTIDTINTANTLNESTVRSRARRQGYLISFVSRAGGNTFLTGTTTATTCW